jgi:hypothetical protein
MSVCQVNPFKLRELAKASGVLAKNDRLNAWMIALFVASMPTRPAQHQTPAATTSSPGAGNQAKAANPLQARRNCWESLFKHGSTAVRSANVAAPGSLGGTKYVRCWTKYVRCWKRLAVMICGGPHMPR